MTNSFETAILRKCSSLRRLLLQTLRHLNGAVMSVRHGISMVYDYNYLQQVYCFPVNGVRFTEVITWELSPTGTEGVPLGNNTRK